jgi:SAM-dependent methyltransferase
VSFDVAADAYDRFMGRFSSQLSPQLTDFGEVVAGQRVIDVGCGPGALTAELVRRIGAEAVAAADPSPPFVAAMRERFPLVDVHQAPAEHLPFADGAFDAALAQLVVHFMTDPVAGLREMARVTRTGGMVAACVWDLHGGRSPLTVFWQAALDLDPHARGEAELPGAREGELAALFNDAGLTSIEETALTASLEFSDFDEWWEPFTFGVGPAGVYAKTLDAEARDRLRDRCREIVGPTPFTIDSAAWAARGVSRTSANAEA